MAKNARAPTPIARLVPDTAPAIIFIHGLGGSPKATWGKMLDCLSGDADFREWAFDCFHFPTCMFRLPLLGPPPPGLRAISEGLKTFIEEQHGSRTSIALVAHSLGGLVARQFVVSEMRAGKRLRIDKLALIAVPSNGSALASVGSLVAFRHRQLRRLSRDDEGLRGLNIDWEQLAVEENLEVRYVLGGCDQAVPHDSALPFFGRDNKMLINASHRSIVQPDGKDDIRYQTIRHFVLDGGAKAVPRFFVPIAAPIEVIGSTIQSTLLLPERPADPLFEAYTPRDEPFYIERAFDNILQQNLGFGHIWLTGESGVGKSASLRRAVYRNGWHLNHLSLAGYEVATPLRLFRALCIELASMAGVEDLPSQDREAGELFLFLRHVLRAFPTDLILANVVEEMPLGRGDLAGFAELLAKFLATLAGDPGLYRRVQFALSSLQSIDHACTPMSPKTLEQIQFLPAERWSVHDAHRLVELLSSTLKSDLSSETQEKIAMSAAGSPRFIKQIFRHWRNGTSGGQSVDQLIGRVLGEQVR
jgi:pimeloyl-ACP methyl ester carboxylesterase